MSRTIQQVIDNLIRPDTPELPAPSYSGEHGKLKIMLAAECMSRHTADAGWQLTKGIESVGYGLYGFRLNYPGPDSQSPDVDKILHHTEPDVCIIQDKREWDCKTAGQRNERYRFKNIQTFKERNGIFKLTVLKDAQQKPEYHRDSADEMGVHGWITYYHPIIVKHVAPYVRTEHLVRTSHSVDKDVVPKFNNKRADMAIFSGAISNHYPMRQHINNHLSELPRVNKITHPGYHAEGCVTPDYLKQLSNYKVAICTSSRYGYLLRKIIEATCVGCIVITDLPVDDQPHFIEQNLVRLPSDVPISQLKSTIDALCRGYDRERQQRIAAIATEWYDWREVAKRLEVNIQQLRSEYNGSKTS